MGNTFKINCKKLYETGIYIDNQVAELKKNIEEMKKLSESIKEMWNGKDYSSFYNNFKEYLDSTVAIETELREKSRIMKEVAMKHNSIDTSLMDTMDKNRGTVE